MAGEQQLSQGCERRERRDSLENRHQILAAARRLFAAQGVDRTPMHEIGREAGVGQGTLYRNFAHKGQLCSALLEDDLAAFISRVDATLDEVSDSPLDLLGWLLEEMVQMTETHVPLLAAMLEGSAGLRRDEVYLTTFYIAIHQRLARLIRTAVEQGEARTLDAELAADAILAALSPHLLGFQRRQRGFSTERISKGVRRLFVGALRRSQPDS